MSTDSNSKYAHPWFSNTSTTDGAYKINKNITQEEVYEKRIQTLEEQLRWEQNKVQEYKRRIELLEHQNNIFHGFLINVLKCIVVDPTLLRLQSSIEQYLREWGLKE